VRANRRASRRAIVGRNVKLDDDALGFVASLGLNPSKARVLLRLALLKTTDVKVIQRYFASTSAHEQAPAHSWRSARK
jgi:L-asparaginase